MKAIRDLNSILATLANMTVEDRTIALSIINRVHGGGTPESLGEICGDENPHHIALNEAVSDELDRLSSSPHTSHISDGDGAPVYPAPAADVSDEHALYFEVPADAPLPQGTVLKDGPTLFGYSEYSDIYWLALPDTGIASQNQLAWAPMPSVPLLKQYLQCVYGEDLKGAGLWWVRDGEGLLHLYDGASGMIRKALPDNGHVITDGGPLSAHLLRFATTNAEGLRRDAFTRCNIYRTQGKIFVQLKGDTASQCYEVCPHAYLVTRGGIEEALAREGGRWTLPENERLGAHILDVAMAADRCARFPLPHEFWSTQSASTETSGNSLRWVVPVRPLQAIVTTSVTEDGVVAVPCNEAVHWPDQKLTVDVLADYAQRDPRYFYKCLNALGVIKVNSMRAYFTGKKRPTGHTVRKHVDMFMAAWGYAVSNKNSYDLVAGIE